MEEHERISLMAAVGVVVLAIAAFVSFVLTGGSAIFYVFAVLALVVGFYMSYRISREGQMSAEQTQQKRAAPRRKR